MNRIIKFLIIPDFLLFTSFGLTDPILAVFFKEEIIGGTLLKAGFASTVFLLVQSIVQLPFSRYVDAHRDDNFRIHWLLIGRLLISSVPFIYIFARDMNMVFFAQVVYGIGAGLAYPTWLGLWSAHLDKNKESFEWSLYSTLTVIGTAASATIGATLSQLIGFSFTFVLVGTLSLIGCAMLFRLDQQIHKELKQKNILSARLRSKHHKKLKSRA